MYADVEALCRAVEDADSAGASEEALRRLLGLFHDQQREPEQIRSFVQHLGVPDEVIGRALGEAEPGADTEDDPGMA
jgi:hypothetical protein